MLRDDSLPAAAPSTDLHRPARPAPTAPSCWRCGSARPRREWDWAVGRLLDARRGHRRGSATADCAAPPELRKLLADNLDPLSRLAGFDPATADRHLARAADHTLRFAEVLAKIYLSVHRRRAAVPVHRDEHLDGDDPFPLPDRNESVDDPLGLPDDERRPRLWALRRELLDVDARRRRRGQWTWRADRQPRCASEFGYAARRPAETR